MNLLKLMLGCFCLQLAVNSDMFFNERTSDLFSIQSLVEIFLLIIGFYFVAKFYKND